MLPNESQKRSMESMEIGRAETPHGKPEMSIGEAFVKIWWFVASAVVAILILFIFTVKFFTGSPKAPTVCPTPTPSPLPKGFWAYDSNVVMKELFDLRKEPAFHYKSNPWWKHADEQDVHSNANAPDIDDISSYSGPAIYKYSDYMDKDDPTADWLPYNTIVDNTEAIAAFADIVTGGPDDRGLVTKDAFLLDLGGGRYNSSKNWVEQKRSDVTMMVADPFNRPVWENVNVQQEVESRGGADVVTSMSVLNVVIELKFQTFHVWLVHRVLKPGGIAIFKAWAGIWPVRGTRRQTVDKPFNGDPHMNPSSKKKRMAQNNAFADTFKPLVEAVFGEGNVYADVLMNMIVARKKTATE